MTAPAATQGENYVVRVRQSCCGTFEMHNSGNFGNDLPYLYFGQSAGLRAQSPLSIRYRPTASRKMTRWRLTYLLTYYTYLFGPSRSAGTDGALARVSGRTCHEATSPKDMDHSTTQGERRRRDTSVHSRGSLRGPLWPREHLSLLLGAPLRDHMAVRSDGRQQLGLEGC